jgi:hypothetical protein
MAKRRRKFPLVIVIVGGGDKSRRNPDLVGGLNYCDGRKDFDGN